jgi:competence protein ComEC
MKIIILCFVIQFIGCTSITGPQTESRTARSEDVSSYNEGILRIMALDVGQGDATLIVTPDNQTILIDGGPIDSGLEVLIPTFEANGISSLDWIFVSHYDGDHIGGLLDLIPGKDKVLGTEDDWIPKNGILDRGNFETDGLTFTNWYKGVMGEHRVFVEAGDQWNIGGAEITAHVVNGNYSDGRSISLPEDENSRSLVLLIEYGDFKYLTTGDLPGGGPSGFDEAIDLETHLGEIVGDLDALHIGHHGSRTSTNEKFLDLVQPELAIISSGKNNDYGHPHMVVTQRLRDRGIEILETQNGNIVIEADGANK